MPTTNSTTPRKEKIIVGVMNRDCEQFKKGQRVYKYPFWTHGAAASGEQAIMEEAGPDAQIHCIDERAIDWTEETVEAEIPR